MSAKKPIAPAGKWYRSRDRVFVENCSCAIGVYCDKGRAMFVELKHDNIGRRHWGLWLDNPRVRSKLRAALGMLGTVPDFPMMVEFLSEELRNRGRVGASEKARQWLIAWRNTYDDSDPDT